MEKIAFYGAKSLALGMYRAVRFLYPEVECIGFIVTSMRGNPRELGGQRVWRLDALRGSLSEEERERLKILIAVPEDVQDEISECLRENGFANFICMDSRREAALMERYYTGRGIFPPLHVQDGREAGLCVYQARFCGDRPLERKYELPGWVVPLQVGAEGAGERICAHRDNQGENISGKNANYCELTGLYWLWKNRLAPEGVQPEDRREHAEYYGLFHYRRLLDISGEDLYQMERRRVDVVLPYPTLHEPDMGEHHARYVKDGDWEAMRQALLELQPEYGAAFHSLLRQPYLYNYNLIVARRQVLAEYCAWLFPILARTEELSTPRGAERKDRYLGYLAESLETLYFLYHRKDLNIVHTGRIMLI